MPMPVAKITGQGLCAIALAVALLWGCLLGERQMVRHAAARRVKILRELRQLRQPIPAEAPLAPNAHPMITVG